MYAIHTTPGFIIDSKTYGEAGKTLSIFTRDLGLIRAVAQGVRLEKSKLRYYTQDFSLGIFSFVRGKEFWRLTSAQELDAGFKISDLTTGHSQELIARLALLLRRLLHGEEPHQELFACIESCARFLAEQKEISDEHMKALESLIVLRIMDALGYIGKDGTLEKFKGSDQISTALLDEAKGERMLINQHINKALKESHL